MLTHLALLGPSGLPHALCGRRDHGKLAMSWALDDPPQGVCMRCARVARGEALAPASAKTVETFRPNVAVNLMLAKVFRRGVPGVRRHWLGRARAWFEGAERASERPRRGRRRAALAEIGYTHSIPYAWLVRRDMLAGLRPWPNPENATDAPGSQNGHLPDPAAIPAPVRPSAATVGPFPSAQATEHCRVHGDFIAGSAWDGHCPYCALEAHGDGFASSAKNPRAVAIGRLGGAKGGYERARRLSPERRREIAALAARARWAPKPPTTLP